MAKTGLIAVIAVLAVFFATGLIQARTMPGAEDMIKDRLRSDLRDLRQRYNSLSKECEQHRKRVKELEKKLKERQQKPVDASDSELAGELKNKERELTRQRRINRQLHRINHELEKEIISLREEGDTKSEVLKTDTKLVDEDITKLEQEEGDEGSSEWLTAGRPYPVRREPLDYEKEYVTTHIDNLSRLAHQFYGDGSYWYKLYKANEDRLADPHSLPSGTRLRLPPIDELEKD
ncbi:MAG: hypothetical protein ACLFN5_03955 [bacterium]